MNYLIGEGYHILETNYRCPYGEIDLIAQAPDQTIVFIEVKGRNSRKFGYALEAVTSSKCHKIRKTSRFYISEKRYDIQQGFRYDVIVFQNNQLEHIKNAFE